MTPKSRLNLLMISALLIKANCYSHMLELNHYAPTINPYLLLLNIISGRTDTEHLHTIPEQYQKI